MKIKNHKEAEHFWNGMIHMAQVLATSSPESSEAYLNILRSNGNKMTADIASKFWPDAVTYASNLRKNEEFTSIATAFYKLADRLRRSGHTVIALQLEGVAEEMRHEP